MKYYHITILVMITLSFCFGCSKQVKHNENMKMQNFLQEAKTFIANTDTLKTNVVIRQGEGTESHSVVIEGEIESQDFLNLFKGAFMTRVVDSNSPPLIWRIQVNTNLHHVITQQERQKAFENRVRENMRKKRSSSSSTNQLDKPTKPL